MTEDSKDEKGDVESPEHVESHDHAHHTKAHHNKDSHKKKSSGGWAKLKNAVAEAGLTGGSDSAKDEASDAVEDQQKALEDQLLRLRADFDNFRKRTMKEKTDLYRLANEDIMLEMLPVLDHMDLALSADVEHGADESFVAGVKLVAEQMQSVLGKFGLQQINAFGEKFDHNKHEAIAHLPSEEFPVDAVMNQSRCGYFLGDKLLRPAQVIVSSGSGVQSAAAEQADSDVADNNGGE